MADIADIAIDHDSQRRGVADGLRKDIREIKRHCGIFADPCGRIVNRMRPLDVRTKRVETRLNPTDA